ncbi:STAS domain-containing protein [Pontibacter chitinilyticus]|uniref:STAS domain-containing protein n=1 Tax=Pontibacter chitinilyticus TaxID=2674989 RepID=UPI00321B67D5
MTVIVQHIKECCFVLAKGELEGSDCVEVEKAVRETAHMQFKNVWVDCEHLTSITTQALRMVLSQTSKAEATGVNLVLYQVPASLLKKIKESGLDKVLHIVPTITDAYQFCKNRR